MAIRPADHGIFASAVAAATGAGYFAGGVNWGGAGVVAAVDRFAFPSDARTTLGTGLPAGKNEGAGMANSGTAGYFGGGYGPAPGYTYSAAIYKLAFADDTFTTLSGTLTAAVYSLAAMANSGTAGYFGGGTAPSYVATVDKFAFSDDSRSTLGTGLSSARHYVAGMANSGTAGYFGGGSTGSNVTTVDKFAFSDDGRTTLGTGLSAATTALAAMANSGTL